MKRKLYPQKSASRGTKSEGSAQLGGRKLASHAGEYEMRIFDGNGEMFQFEPDEFSVSMLATTKPEWISSELFFEAADSLRGFTPEMALIIADDVIDCWCGLGLHYTGCEHIDAILSRLYGKIISCAFKKGIELNHSK